MLTDKKRILIFTDWFAPGFKAGGPIRSCVNFAEHMRSNYDIYIFTGDRDFKSDIPYPNISVDEWMNIAEGIYVFYASRRSLNWSDILKNLRKIQPKYIYLNSMFSKYYSIYPLLMKVYGKTGAGVVLAPRGMLKASALEFKPLKKKIFLGLLRILNIKRHIRFHATDDTEVNDIKKQFGERAAVTYIANFPGFQKPIKLPNTKNIGKVKIVFIGRIHPIKNLHLLLHCLEQVKNDVLLTIVGVLEDVDYWQKCEKLVCILPSNVQVKFINEVPHTAIEALLLDHHLFCLPTQGENFGHAIFEALANGRPVLISDQTPWKDLTVCKAGWDLSLTKIDRFTDIINEVAAMNLEELNEWCTGAWVYCNNSICQSDIKEQYIKLFK